MEKYFDILLRSPLFGGIDKTELEPLLSCLSAKTSAFNKNDTIFSANDAITSIGFVLAGSVHIVQDDFWGNRTIIANITTGNTFAEAIACANAGSMPVSVIAAEECKIMLIDYPRIIKTCPTSCEYHSSLVKNMIGILASKNMLLTRKIEHISKRSTREKLLSYLSFQALQTDDATFAIPFDRQGLADYLAVDRSALSSELSKLQKDGVLKYNKNMFTLEK